MQKKTIPTGKSPNKDILMKICVQSFKNLFSESKFVMSWQITSPDN